MLKLYSFIVVSIFTLLSTAKDCGSQPNDFYLEAKDFPGKPFVYVTPKSGEYVAFLEPQRTLLKFEHTKLVFNGKAATLGKHGKVVFENTGDPLKVSYHCDPNHGEWTLSPDFESMFHGSNHMLFYRFLIFSVSIIGFCVAKENGSWELYVQGQGHSKHILLSQIPSFLYTSTNSIC
jgi:hypothetical protein